MKRLYADDSADSRVKVGNRQAPLKPETPARQGGGFCIGAAEMCAVHLAWAASRVECADGHDAADRVGDAHGERVFGDVCVAQGRASGVGVPILCHVPRALCGCALSLVDSE